MLHTRLRPHCKEFLEKIAKLYELHVFTFARALVQVGVGLELIPSGVNQSQTAAHHDQNLVVAPHAHRSTGPELCRLRARQRVPVSRHHKQRNQKNKEGHFREQSGQKWYFGIRLKNCNQWKCDVL